MPEHHPEAADVDLPEPEDALSGVPARGTDHEPADLDDREVDLDDPDAHDPPIDDTEAPGED
ncbi:hypothetical protein FSW04_25335 [Baekduia soli]|uniref:Uncharacterized protein n=1 Tax=Baekduia soli TaxID=496014 RepID=A0A5B8UD21_9ACTN|nr:hypothetical protein [Baekduia soli]QEC50581.1 hypothetical protein FSW04_25335 [Baekduia soli]